MSAVRMENRGCFSVKLGEENANPDRHVFYEFYVFSAGKSNCHWRFSLNFQRSFEYKESQKEVLYMDLPACPGSVKVGVEVE